MSFSGGGFDLNRKADLSVAALNQQSSYPTVNADQLCGKLTEMGSAGQSGLCGLQLAHARLTASAIASSRVFPLNMAALRDATLPM